jgi:putative thioredoxin
VGDLFHEGLDRGAVRAHGFICDLVEQVRRALFRESFLEVVGLDRALREDGGRRALLSLFDLLGAENELTPRYRKRLANALY